MSRVPTLVALLVALLGVACGRLPATHLYVLDAGDRLGAGESSTRGSEAGAGLLVGVEPFRVDPPYDHDAIVYRVGERSAEVGHYAYHRWAAPLSRLLPVSVARALVATPGIAAIEPRAPGAEYDATLTGRVLAFEELDTADGQHVRLHIRMGLRRLDGTELWRGELRGERSTRTESVADVVALMGELLRDLLAEARPELERALASGAR